jgi:hypothetical protein
MPDPDQTTNGATGPQSLREVAEAAYDEVTEISESDGQEPVTEVDSGQGDRPRDKQGRWVRKDGQPGEAAAETPPSPEIDDSTQKAAQQHPAPVTGVAAQPPSNWSAEDRANFEKLPPEGKAFLLKRHSEMEGDYQKRVQATAISNQFVTAVTPVFNDPEIAESLRRDGRSPIEAIYQWGGFHKRAMSPDVQTRVGLLFELADRMQLDPAAVFGHLQSAPSMAFSQEELANPAVKKFADHIGQLASRLQTQEQEFQRIRQHEQEALVGAKRMEIDTFADRKNADGSLAHPYFDAFLPVIMEHYKSGPDVTMEMAYERAVKPITEQMQAHLKSQLDNEQNLQRAQNAVRSNVRGTTAPVSKPAAPGGKRGLRQVMEETADEIGY